jgi:8-oxo-dGTP diphosphatase
MKHRIRVSGILRRGDHILLVHQQNPLTGDCHWAVPGGGLEAGDPDIFAGVEREVFEETGLRVRAGQMRFVSEYQSSDLLQLNVWIECHPTDGDAGFGELSNANVLEDDYIIGAEWWSRESLADIEHKTPVVLRDHKFWAALETSQAQVLHLGRRVV